MSEQEQLNETSTGRSLDDVLEEIGGFGWFQKYVFILTCFPYLLAGFFYLNAVFILGIPNHRCAIPGYTNDTYKIQSDEHLSLVNSTIPLSTVEGRVYDRCFVFEYQNSGALHSNSSGSSNDSRQKRKCDKWVYDKDVYKNTFVSQGRRKLQGRSQYNQAPVEQLSEMLSQIKRKYEKEDDKYATAEVNLVCDKEIWVANAEMIFYGGMLLGSLASGLLADWYGRKPVMYVSMLIMTGASIGLAWVTEYWLFCVVEFVIGASVITSFMPGFVISIEITSPSKRFWPGIVSNYPYVIGLLILTGIAYGFRDWFYIELFTSLPGVITIAFYWLIPESPRWLLSQGRVKEAEAIIVKAAKWNKAVLPEGPLFDKQSVGVKHSTVSFIQLFTHKTLCIRTILILFNWMSVSLAYFGLALNSGNLSVDVYLNFGLSGLVEFPAYLIVTYLVERFGRRVLLAVLMIIGGISCLSTILSMQFAKQGGDVITFVLTLSGRLCITGAFAVVYIQSVELFPTVVRNAGMGGASLSARLGTMVAPYIVTLGDTMGGTIGQALPLSIFGLVSLISGITTLWLPETLNKNLPETIQDGETFGKNVKEEVLEVAVTNSVFTNGQKCEQHDQVSSLTNEQKEEQYG